MTLPLNTVVVGDALEVLRQWPADSVDCCVTDPPYGLSFMGKAWDYEVPKVELWREVHRVLKDGGRLFAFSGARTQHRMVCNIEDAGFTIEDCMMWLYGSGFPKHKSKLKPAYEPICVARKGKVSLLNIDAARIGTDMVGARGMNQSGEASRNLAFGMKELAGGNPTVGRWPANICLDEEAAAMLDEQSGTLTSGKMAGGTPRANRGGWSGPTPETTGDETYGDSGGASRFFYCAKASRSEREAGLEGLPLYTGVGTMSGDADGSLLTGAGNPRNTTAHNNHPTVKPIALMRWLVRLASFPGQIILDPFMGSGTTGIACEQEGRQWVGIEINQDYAAMAERRIKGPLFAEVSND